MSPVTRLWTPCRASPTYPSVDHHIHLWAADSGQRGIEASAHLSRDQTNQTKDPEHFADRLAFVAKKDQHSTSPIPHCLSLEPLFFRLCAQPLTLNSRRTSPLLFGSHTVDLPRRPIFIISSHPAIELDSFSPAATDSDTENHTQLTSAQLPPLPAVAKCPTKDLPPSISASARPLVWTDSPTRLPPSPVTSLSRRPPSLPPPIAAAPALSHHNHGRSPAPPVLRDHAHRRTSPFAQLNLSPTGQNRNWTPLLLPDTQFARKIRLCSDSLPADCRE